MAVGHLGPNDVVTVTPEATVGGVVDRLESGKVGSVVVSEHDESVGIVTDPDVALAATWTDDVASEGATEVMSDDPATLPEDAEGMEISRVFGENDVHRVPVVDDGKLAGIATLDDFVATVGEELDNVADTIESQSPSYQP